MNALAHSTAAVALALAVACGGGRNAAVQPPEPTPLENTGARRTDVCPPLDATIDELHPMRTARDVLVVRQCEPGWFAGRGFFATVSVGPPDEAQTIDPDDPQSVDEPWWVRRLVVDDTGRAIAVGPPQDTQWRTGVAVGAITFADLDGDETDEIIEVVDEPVESLLMTATLLEVWRIDGGELRLALEIPLSYGMEHPDMPPACQVSFSVETTGLRLDARALGEPTTSGPVYHAFETDVGALECLGPGTWEYRLIDGAFRGQLEH